MNCPCDKKSDSLGRVRHSVQKKLVAMKMCRDRCQTELDKAEFVPTDHCANALDGLGAGESPTETFKKAVEPYRQVLKERIRERVLFQWAATQNDFGNGLGALSEQGSRADRLKKRLEAYRNALKEIRARASRLGGGPEETRKSASTDWGARER